MADWTGWFDVGSWEVEVEERMSERRSRRIRMRRRNGKQETRKRKEETSKVESRELKKVARKNKDAGRCEAIETLVAYDETNPAKGCPMRCNRKRNMAAASQTGMAPVSDKVLSWEWGVRQQAACGRCTMLDGK